MAQRDQFLATYQSGNLPIAENNLTTSIEKELPQSDYRRSKDAVWLLLDRATTRFAKGDTQYAIDDYRLAIEAMDYYNQDFPAESLGKVILQDNYGAYQGAPFEQVLARLYFALALLHQGDVNNAFAILRQGEELQQIIRDQYTNTPFMRHYELLDNAVSKYLFAALLEKRCDQSNANILYKQSEDLLGTQYIPSESSSDKTATVLVICHNGNVARKVSDISDASVASAAALEILLASQDIQPAFSTLAGIPVPALYQSPASLPTPMTVCIHNIQKQLSPWYNVSNVSYENLQQELPVIVARGVARLLLRRGAVAYAQDQDPCLGAIVDIGFLIANANTEADTRAWSTLPSSIDVARYDLPAGQHALSIQAGQKGCSFFQEQHKLELRPHDLCIINVFHIHPGVTTVLVPSRFVYPNPNNKEIL